MVLPLPKGVTGLVPKQMSTGDRTILGRTLRMRCTDRKLTPTAGLSNARFSRRRAKCQVNHPLHGDCRQRRLSCRGSGRQCLPP